MRHNRSKWSFIVVGFLLGYAFLCFLSILAWRWHALLVFSFLLYSSLGFYALFKWNLLKTWQKWAISFIAVKIIFEYILLVIESAFFSHLIYYAGSIPHKELSKFDELFLNIRVLFNRATQFPFIRYYQGIKTVNGYVSGVVPVWSKILRSLMNLIWVGGVGAILSIFYGKGKRIILKIKKDFDEEAKIWERFK